MFVAALCAGAILLAACGGGGHASHSSAGGSASGGRTVQVDMVDIGFSIHDVTVHPDESVRFVFQNKGSIDHEAFIGDAAAQAQHEKDMAQHSDMQHASADDITVSPGKTGELTHTFKAGDELLIGCHEPGHYAQGMKIQITVN
jgi:uncharacterized cupredoxin-like copper-binding protein